MKKIELTQGKFALVDDADYKYINQFKWCFKKDRNDKGYAVRKENGKITKMQFLILEKQDGLIIDHINMNGIDNRKENLRLCTKAENCQNRSIRKDSSSGYKGVFRTKNSKKNPWRARVTNNGKRINLGVFPSKKEASMAYNEKAKELFGDFAAINNLST